ncbi:MAG: serine/threonine protein kinase [Myxococcales bacterium]|nr:serine/threonine protein kinase [Myxococcales bacterium]
MVDETGLHNEALEATELAGAETLVQTAGGTILDDDPVVDIERGTEIGRYTILERLGSGAMGVVYTAYDPKLDRRVALKLLRLPPGEAGGEMVARLIREAQALAKLNHPNVVTIHDADVLGDQVYLAMELVEGTNLARWLRGGQRTLAEILDRFLQAGRGLAAAHQVGLVHRDFKPDNVLLGDDGRVRVADFGIARNADEDPLEGPSAVARVVADLEPVSQISTARLTQTGAVVGTPAYMAPEQHLGTRVDARCDQFSFCVALFEAVFGSHPFPAKGYMDLRRRVLSGELAPIPPRTDVPPHVRAAILRGLSVIPDRRFPSMEELLAALDFDPQKRRRRLINVGLAVGVTALLAGAGVYSLTSARAACEDSERHLAGIWDDEVRGVAEAAFAATGRPYAAKAWETSAGALDRYAAAWVDVRRQACEATEVYHEQSPELLDRRMACLDGHLRRLGATASLFREADSEVVLRAVEAAEALPPLDACSNTDALLRGEAPPSGEARRDFDRFDELVARAAALEIASRYTDSLAIADDALALADRLGSRRAEARALWAKAKADDQMGHSLAAAELLGAAADLAERAGDDELRGDLWSHLGFIEGLSLERHEEAEHRLRHTEAIYERVRASDQKRAHLASRLGAVLLARGRYDEALATLQRALDILGEGAGDQSMVRMSTLNIMGSAYDLRGDLDPALEHYRKALAIAERQVGPDHPETAKILNNIAIIHKGRGELEEARRHAERVVTIYRRVFGEAHPDFAASLANLANLQLSAGDYEGALASYDEALRALQAAEAGPGEVGRLLYNLGVAYHLRGRFAEAAESYARSLELQTPVLGPDHPEIAYPLTGLGSSLVELGRFDDALPHLERALAIRSRKDVPPIDIGEIRFALARALPIGERERALELARAAERDYEELGDPATAAAIRAWIAANAVIDG